MRRYSYANFGTFFAPPGIKVQIIVISVFACLSVCLSVRSHISKTTVQILRIFLYILSMPVAYSSSDNSAVRFCGWRHVFTQCKQWARI